GPGFAGGRVHGAQSPLGVRLAHLGRSPRGLRLRPVGSPTGGPRQGDRRRECPLSAGVLLRRGHAGKWVAEGNRIRVVAAVLSSAPVAVVLPGAPPRPA